MSDKYPLGEVIAARELAFLRKNGSEEIVWVRIGKPYQEGSGEPWLCPYEIASPTKKRNFAMAGVDSMQALILTTRTILPELEHWSRTENGTFSYGGGLDTGFTD